MVAAILVDESDWKVDHIATSDLAEDIESVTGNRPRVETAAHRSSEVVLLIGTIGRNSMLDWLIAAGKIDVSLVILHPLL